MAIHPTAIIHPTAVLGSGVAVGPYTVIGPRVVVGEDTEIQAHVCIDKDTTIGQRCRLFPFASIGADPQDMKYAGEETRLEIGDDVTIRESATIHRGTTAGGGVTRIGDKSLVMATVHVAHDCQIQNEVILSSFAVLAGHVHIDEQAIVSGSTAIHQFVRVGRQAFIGGMSGVVKDAPPYMILAGVRDQAVVVSPNAVGMRRRGFSETALEAIAGAFKLLRSHVPLKEVLAEIETKWPDSPEAAVIVDFYRGSSRGRGVYR
ncbi:MAG: acyl-ACP--UDP-N-acetylglucosamine O-acyltransferase [Deltaproteobacteria bacterium]|jgi:UDP-N-acetylglucosamine acyltransferase|nr:acyl-ACP--UDP-N-acetylglucosamine O-acyltransferase [Deltaproteobacteria bacterium]